MTRQIFSGKSQYVPAATTKTLHTGPGKIYAIFIATTIRTSAIVTVTDGAATLLTAAVSLDFPIIIFLPQNQPILFTTSLVVTTAASTYAYILTEA